VYQFGIGTSVFDIQIDAAEASGSRTDANPSILFPNKDLLFTADFRRSGADLLLIGHEMTAVIIGYFRHEQRPSLTTREGASLTGETVEALAGTDPPGQYAQAANGAATRTPIGRVEKVSGSATVLRNGVPVELHLGDMVAKGDVVQTAPDATLTIRFNDGTVFGLSSSARMVLNDMVYTAESKSNSALFTLVQGAIGFVAGRIAKTGDLKVDTPVATMAIRGTAVHTEIAAFSGVTRFSLLTEPDGTVGSFLLLDKDNPSRVITSVSDSRIATLLTPAAASGPVVTQVAKTADEIRGEGDFVRSLFQIFSPEPRQRRGSSEFEDAPAVPVNVPQLVDPTDPSRFNVTIFVPDRFALGELILPPLVSIPAPIRGMAIEDGPLVRLSAFSDAVQSLGAALPLVSVPASLPPGVSYVESSRSFYLNPSHPAYQHLGQGESTTVTVNYALLVAGTPVPTSVAWTVAGRNDAPVAVGDRIGAVSETGRKVLAVRANDYDVDGDALHIVRWTAPLEGVVSLNSSGELIFDPGDDFRALSAGETATVSFTYTVSDGNGGTDNANVTLQVLGAGTFSSPRKTASTTGILEFNNQPVSLTVAAPSATTTPVTDLDLVVSLGPVLQPQMNILYLVDISGSTSEVFEGTSVGDLNGDGRSDTVLDAEIASLISLTERVRELGFSPADVSVAVIPFNGSADPAEGNNLSGNPLTAATFTLGKPGEGAIANYLKGLNANGLTNFADALRVANERLQSLDQGNEENFLYFLSDGVGQGSIEGELTRLNDVFRAKITAVGVGGDASLAQLNAIDNTGGASLLTSPDQIDISVLGSPVASGTIVDLDIVVNGKDVAEIGPEDLVSTPAGLALSASVGGLERFAGGRNTLSASVAFAGGEVLATELIIAGALPRSTDFVL